MRLPVITFTLMTAPMLDLRSPGLCIVFAGILLLAARVLARLDARI